MILHPTPCSRCGSRVPMRGCVVCADSPEPETDMSTITISQIQALRDQLLADAHAVNSILHRAEAGHINPEQAEKELKERGIAIFSNTKP